MYNDQIVETTYEVFDLFLNEGIEYDEIFELIESGYIDSELLEDMLTDFICENTASGMASFASLSKNSIRDYAINKLPNSSFKSFLMQSKAKDMIKSGDKINGYKLSADAHFDSMNRAYNSGMPNKFDRYTTHNDLRSRKLGIVRKLLNRKNNI